MKSKHKEEQKESAGSQNEQVMDWLERIFLEIRWLQKNQSPPVNYFLVIFFSVVSAVITTLILIH